MKPIRLDISGLNSFRQKQSIEFDLLLHDGIFGIFGPTGSGKSSILDAITLALYGEVKRAPRKHGGVINMQEKNCTVSLTFEIGSYLDRRRYTVARHLVRTKSNGTETKRVWLREHRDSQEIPIAEKEKDVADRIGEILGITLDDFLRAVVLPQGAFAGFLSLKPSERGEVLQRLFGLNEFGEKLGRKLSGVLTETQRGRDEYAGRLTELAKYDDDALRACHDAVTAAAEVRDAAAAEHKRIEQLHTDSRALFDLIVERDRVRTEAAGRAQEEERLRGLRERIELAERSRAVDPAVRAMEDAEKRYADAAVAYENAKRTRQEIDGALVAARDRHIRAEREYSDQFDRLGRDLVRLEGIGEEKQVLQDQKKELHAVVGTVEEYVSEQERVVKERDALAQETTLIDQEIGRLRTEVEKITVSAVERERAREIDRTLSAVEANRQRSEIAERRKAEHTATIERTEKVLREQEEREGAHGDSLRNLKSALTENKRRLGTLSTERDNVGDLYRFLKNGLDSLVSVDLESARNGLENTRRQVAETEKLLVSATEVEREAQREYDAVTLRRDEARHRLALTSVLGDLRDGDPCPLCGSVEHPAPHRPDDEEDRRIRESEEELRRADLRLNESRVRTRNAAENAAAGKSTLAALEQSYRNAEESVRATFHAINEKLHDGAPKMATVDELRLLTSETEGVGRKLRGEIDATDETIRSLEREIEDAEQVARKFLSEQATRRSELESAKRQEAEAREEIETMRAEQVRLMGLLAELVPGLGVEEAGKELKEIAGRESRAEEIGGKIRALEIEYRGKKDQLDAAERKAQDVTSRKEQAEARRTQIDEEIRRKTGEILARLREIITENETGTSVEKLIEHRQALRDRIEREREESRKEYHDLENQEKVASARVEDCAKIRGREESERDRHTQECVETLHEHGFTSVEDVRLGLLDPEQLKVIRSDAEEIETRSKRIAEKLEELVGQIGDRSISEEEVARIEAELKEAEATDRAALEAYGAAQDRLRECGERNVEWRAVSRANEKAEHRSAMVEQLAKYLRGNGFVNFLANERLDDICRRASSLLQTLTSNRLELGTRPEDGFFIRDNGNGGGERATGSLSGGETFLVSLSLALALSDTIQLGRAPLEFFFLDEGFGTLDAELLETVMSALERLRSNHRAIGVITHVGQLRERITRRLIVTPPTESRGTIVAYDTA